MALIIGDKQATFTGKWAAPAGWRPVWYWMGTLTEGIRKGVLVQWPDLVLCRTPRDVAEAERGGWTPASKLPIEVQRIALICYGDDLTPEHRAMFAEGAAEAERERAAKKAKAAPKKAAAKKTVGRKK